MKKLFLILSIAVTLILVGIGSATADTYIVRTNDGDGVYIRDPVTHEHLKDSKGKNLVAREGQIIDVIRRDNSWLYIRLSNGEIGIVYAQYAVPYPGGGIEPPPTKPVERVTINNDYAILKGVTLKDCKVYKTDDYSKRIGKLEEGSELFIRQTGKYWYKIIYQGSQIAYIEKKYVKLTDANIPGEGTVYKVSNVGINESATRFAIREAPSFDAKSIVTSEFGVYVRVLEEIDNTWVKVAFGTQGITGYMRKVWLREVTMF